MSETTSSSKEVLILKNPMSYRDVDSESFDLLIKDGVWIPIVFNTLKSVVENHFYDLCDLNWDYAMTESQIPETHGRYKTLYYVGLNEEQIAFVRMVADEIEEELRRNALDAVASKREEGEDETAQDFDE